MKYKLIRTNSTSEVQNGTYSGGIVVGDVKITEDENAMLSWHWFL